MYLMGFSREQSKIDAVALKIRRAKTMAVVGTNPDFVLKHPDWVRDAQKKDFTMLTKKTKEDAEKYQKMYLQRRLKMVGKD